MNKELERKLKNNEQAKALFLEYKNKEDKIKKMLKEYENAKESGATTQELLMLKKAIRNEQQPLLESFYRYKELENKVSEKKQEVPVKPISQETQVKSAKKIVNVQKKNDEVPTKQVAEIKVMPVRRIKSTPRRLEKETRMAKIIPMPERKVKNKPKLLVKSIKRAIRRPIVTKKKALKSNVVTMSKMARIKRRMARNVKRTIKSFSRKQQVRRYRAMKNRNQFVTRKRPKSIKHRLKKRMKALRRFLRNEPQTKKQKKIEPPIQKRHKRQFTTFDMYRGTVQNWDGHIEANANRKISKIPSRDQEEDKLDVIGWR